MRKTFSLTAVALLAATAMLVSCGEKNEPEMQKSSNQNNGTPTQTDPTTQTDPPAPEDTTKFTASSIMGIWACIGTLNEEYNYQTGQLEEYWDYNPRAQKYSVSWYFDIQSPTRVQYISVEGEQDGQYRRSDGYLHIPLNSRWTPDVDANYIFDEEHQAIRCTSGNIMGFSLETVAALLESDTIFYVERKGADEAIIIDNTGYFYTQYVVRVKGIKKDLASPN